LGLVISQLIVLKFDGQISFKSKYKCGSIFTYTFGLEQFDSDLLLPLRISSDPRLRRIKTQFVPASSSPVAGSPYDSNHCNFSKMMKIQGRDRILIVDDEEFCISSMKAIFTSLGVDPAKIDFSISGKEAVRQVKESYGLGISYRFIFTDFNMPELNGIEATSSIRRHLDKLGIVRRKQPIIVGVTGHVGEKFIDEGMASGMDTVCSKPFYKDKAEAVF